MKSDMPFLGVRVPRRAPWHAGAPPWRVDADPAQPLVPEDGRKGRPRRDERAGVDADEQRCQSRGGVADRFEGEVGGQVVDRVRAECADARRTPECRQVVA